MSREDNAGFFTRGVDPIRYQLPHQRLGMPVVLLIRRVLLQAIQILRNKNYPFADAIEDQITAALRAVIENDLRQTGVVSGFSRRTYESVVRQGQVANYDGSRLSKTPDLFFKLRCDDSESYAGLSEYDGLFVECKPVGKSHSVGAKYCDDGLIRFVRGDYAWAMQEGMMLAYVRDGRTIADHLIPAMSESTRIGTMATIQLPEKLSSAQQELTSQAEPIHASTHSRNFPWPDDKGPACNITIYHLWHDCG